ncbi:hypothetical protein F442_10890 [Phytophthora nicotianae P10297]|uniref:Uncharacterized protein n=3 Tax=Phytophthora nicotianae TaxID=4792 RepID=V9EYD4_PHYNI|nr:hypothetical protein F443_10996 [Phytophthora nicotianae P1569]ETK84309.1 hypothetical protein L915_10717 [Phytophthora nicotianae]ETL37748.1 hypothetical protein L916_10608 [Phytophthora nicotianae]ETL90893.1 hypothetical protein L917_10512 [Phytophthora nicotianae]ETP42184.1 hypothetical protein F442_10890 [Phytophthora nicotianae P10297]
MIGPWHWSYAFVGSSNTSIRGCGGNGDSRKLEQLQTKA